ncbi:transposase [Lacticaseibacillus casei]|nr:transposase [Lacticaseibacillus casei]
MMAKGKYQEWQTPEKMALIEGWARDGLTDEQIAHNIGIKRPTLYDWKKKYSDISDALKRGKEVVDQMVAGSLVKRALGMTITNTTYKMVPIRDDVLEAKRARWRNEHQIDHPEFTRKELVQASIENVPTYEKIPIMVNENELAPDTSAQIFWLKNRKPELFRDQAFKQLNEAQAKKAAEEVRKSKAEADIMEAKAKLLTDAGAQDRTVIVDDVPEDD